MAKPHVTTVQLRQDPHKINEAFKLGLVHQTPDDNIPLSRMQVKVLMGFFYASQAKLDEPVGRTIDFVDFVLDLMVRAAKDDGYGEYNEVLRKVVGRTVKDKFQIKSIVSDLKPYGRRGDR